MRDSTDAARKGAVLREVSKEPVEFRCWVGGGAGLDVLGGKPITRSEASAGLTLRADPSGLLN